MYCSQNTTVLHVVFSPERQQGRGTNYRSLTPGSSPSGRDVLTEQVRAYPCLAHTDKSACATPGAGAITLKKRSQSDVCPVDRPHSL